MVQLNWIWKDKVINHHHDVPYKVLNKSYTFGDKNSWNKIIHGDNLEALKSLLPQYEGKIDIIYIDPPYNTWEEKWVYNDNVNDPKIKKWLWEVVWKEWDDLSRHDKRLCMMYPRLKLLSRLLSDIWTIFISIDDNEQSNLKSLCDEIFWVNNFEWHIHWRRRSNQPNDKTKMIWLVAEHILVYSKNAFKHKKFWIGKIPLTGNYSNPDNDPKWNWISNPWKAAEWRWWTEYSITTPTWKVYTETWYWTKNTFEKYLNEWRVLWTKKWEWIPRIKKYQFESEEEWQCAVNRWTWENFWSNQWATDELKWIFSGTLPFNNPKPTTLIEKIIWLWSIKKDAIVLDSFAWSWTTAHAVLNLNKQDWGNRKFILIELWDYAEKITAERIKRVINWYEYEAKEVEEIACESLTLSKIKNGAELIEEFETIKETNKEEYDKVSIKVEEKSLKVIWEKNIKWFKEGIWWWFDFYELWDPLFINNEYLNEEVWIDVLRDYIRYTETKSEIQNVESENKYYLGTQFNTDYYFYYKKDGVTILDLNFVSTIPKKGEQMIIYADKCTLSKKFMQEHWIIFKKIPRDITRF